MKIDSQIPDVTGLLAIPLLSDITLKLNLLSSSQKNLLNDGTLNFFVFVSIDSLVHFFQKITQENKRNF